MFTRNAFVLSAVAVSFCSVVVTTQVRVAVAEPVMCAMTGIVECQNGAPTKEFLQSLPNDVRGGCFESLHQHCRVQYMKDLNIKVRDLSEELARCNADLEDGELLMRQLMRRMRKAKTLQR